MERYGFVAYQDRPGMCMDLRGAVLARLVASSLPRGERPGILPPVDNDTISRSGADDLQGEPKAESAVLPIAHSLLCRRHLTN